MIRELEKILRKYIKEKIDIDVIPSERAEFGHYSTNVAFKLAPLVKKSPFEVAKDLVAKLGSSSIPRPRGRDGGHGLATGSRQKRGSPKAAGAIFSKVEAVQAGFINFWLKPEIFRDNLKEILKQKDDYGRNNNLKGEKIMVEFTDPNPFKEFHIGHLMSNTIGEAISRLFEWNGAKVKRANYQGDVGLHVAKAIWGLLQKNSLSLERGIKKLSIKEMADAYAFGAGAYETDAVAKGQINAVNKEIYNQSSKEILKIYKTGRKLSLDYFETLYKKLGTKFDYYFFESETGGIGKEIVEKNIGSPSTSFRPVNWARLAPQGAEGTNYSLNEVEGLHSISLGSAVFEKSDGAVVFKGEKYGLHTRVFINSEGLPTYEAKEIGLFEMKMKKVVCDRYFSVTGNEIDDYFKVMIKVIGILFPKFAGKLVHLSHGMLRLPSGKMSSRTGDVITAESLISEVEEKVEEKMSSRGGSLPAGRRGVSGGKDRKLSIGKKSEIKEVVAIGALKYSILKQAIGGDIIFDFDKSISFEGDSGPYLQYAYTRANSVLENARKQKIKASLKIPAFAEATAGKPAEKINEVEILLERFSEIVGRAGKELAPHYIASYLVELSRAFNHYYAENKIVDSSDKYSPYKVALTEAVAVVMKNGLEILGIRVPEEM